MRRFVDRDDFAVEFLGERDGVVDVVEVAVGDADGIDAIDVVSFRVGGVAVGPGIHEDGLSGWQSKLKRAVTEPGYLHTAIIDRSGAN